MLVLITTIKNINIENQGFEEDKMPKIKIEREVTPCLEN
jgi:hypothetical protein